MEMPGTFSLPGDRPTSLSATLIAHRGSVAERAVATSEITGRKGSVF